MIKNYLVPLIKRGAFIVCLTFLGGSGCVYADSLKGNHQFHQATKKQAIKKRSKKKSRRRTFASYGAIIGLTVVCLCLSIVYFENPPVDFGKPPVEPSSQYFINKPPTSIPYEISDEELKATYDRSWERYSKKKTKEDKKAFLGYEKMVKDLGEQLKEFEAWKARGDWDTFFSEHYDWWVFPIPHNSAGYKMGYAVYKDDIEHLKECTYEGKNYVDLQRRASELILESMGWWDSQKQEITGRCTRVHRAVRRGKMMHGLLLWNPELYKVANALTLELEKVNYPLEKKFRRYITRKTIGPWKAKSAK